MGSAWATYAGRALYEYAGDRRVGQTSGQGMVRFGDIFFLVTPSGGLDICPQREICNG
jgi:hypothetical protein